MTRTEPYEDVIDVLCHSECSEESSTTSACECATGFFATLRMTIKGSFKRSSRGDLFPHRRHFLFVRGAGSRSGAGGRSVLTRLKQFRDESGPACLVRRA